MCNKWMRKGIAVLCAGLLLNAAACKAEPADGGKSQTGDITAVIEAVKQNQVTESSEKTAVITLADTGIKISGTGCEADGSRLKIKEAGTYEISGTLSNGSIYVNVDNESEVHLILNGVTVHNETSAALFCKKAAKVTITLADGSVNTLTDGAVYEFEEGEDEPDATLYAKHDLVINGGGTLSVTSAFGDAIKGKDALYILGGKFLVDSAEDGVIGRDLLYISGGEFTLDTSDDALHSNKDIVLSGGTFQIAAGDDGVHADESLTVSGDCKIDITKSYEGLEALELVIEGGDISIVASDDGLNAAGGADSSGFGGHPGTGMFGEGEGEIVIHGGSLVINANGDGLDSNGNLTIDGGTIVVFGPSGGGNGVLDYGGTFVLNGGTLLAVGGSDMAQTPSDSSGQYSLAAVLTSYAEAEGTVEICVNGKTVIKETVPKRFNYIVASGDAFAADATVVVKVNGEECYTGTLTDVVTCFGFSGGMGGFGGAGDFGGRGDKGEFGGFDNRGEFPPKDFEGFGGGKRPEGERPERPSGEIPMIPGGAGQTVPEVQGDASA